MLRNEKQAGVPGDEESRREGEEEESTRAAAAVAAAAVSDNKGDVGPRPGDSRRLTRSRPHGTFRRKMREALTSQRAADGGRALLRCELLLTYTST